MVQEFTIIVCDLNHLAGVTFLFAALTEVLVGTVESLRLDEGLQGFFLFDIKSVDNEDKHVDQKFNEFATKELFRQLFKTAVFLLHCHLDIAFDI